MPTKTSPPKTPPPRAPIGRLALGLLRFAERERRGPVVHVAADGRRAAAIAAAARAFAPEAGVALYPAWDCFPYDRVPPTRGVMGARMGVLRWLTDGENLPDLVVTTPGALIRLAPPPSVWPAAHLEFAVGEAVDREAVAAALRRIGYCFDERVDEPGEAALRAQVIDLFPAAAPMPCRMELADGRIAAIRSYDPLTQRGEASTDLLVVDPASEIVGLPEEAERPGFADERRLAERYETLASLLDYAPHAVLTAEEGTRARAEDVLDQIADAHAEALALRGESAEARRPLDPRRLFLSREAWGALLDERLAWEAPEPDEADRAPRFVGAVRPRKAFADRVAERRAAGARVVLAADPRALPGFLRRARAAIGAGATPVASWAEAAAAEPGALLSLAAPLEAGFADAQDGIDVVAAPDLDGVHALAGASRAGLLEDEGLAPGATVVHADHGLGTLEGLDAVGVGEEVREAARLRYADGATLLVPVEELDRVWRYGEGSDGESLDRLDSDSWGKRRAAVEASIAQAAARLEEHARARAAAVAPALVPPARAMARFAARFPYALTEDQAAAVDAVLADLASGRPMDRLVCGDVGYGKTEVALRAAAAVAFAGRQVAIVAPTTVLARQHAEAVRRRFAGLGVATGRLSRLVAGEETAATLAGLADGSIRVVVGTHALGGADVRFHDLGLVVIDEEQRFGARRKEELGSLAEGVHVLSMTATPIPQTLQASLVGLRDLSVIATPPVARQPVRTVLAPFDEGLVAEALTREAARGGQSFVVVPRIADIAPAAETLARIAPRLRVVVAHGRMKPEAIEEAMLAFAEGDDPPDVLLATNIVESGLDVPRANAIVVLRPDRFGLADLHQLRGRVGRGARRGTAYLLTEPGASLAEETRARLDALVAADRLGAGFAVSRRDLALRGAGEALGEEQAGHMALTGLGLYRRLLERARAVARGEPPPPEAPPRIAIGLSGAIPADYVEAQEIRLELYGRLARIASAEELDAFEDELADRFGPPPEALDDLLDLAALALRCRGLGIARLEGGPQALAATFEEEAGRRLARAGPPPAPLAWKGARLVYEARSEDARERLAASEDFLDAVAALARGRAAPRAAE